MLNVVWGDCLSKLADRLFDSAFPHADPFKPECVIVGNKITSTWLKQHFLFEKENQKQRVFANWDFALLHQFVNDWLAYNQNHTGKRQVSLHPYAMDNLHWRIYKQLGSAVTRAELKVLADYINVQGSPVPLRRWGLAGQLARLFDDYQNYRPDMLLQWEKGEIANLDSALQWQPIIWRDLVTENGDTYLQQFINMENSLFGEQIAQTFRRVSIFNVASMPIPYLHFFFCLSEYLPVDLYAFNPSREAWFDDNLSQGQRYFSLIGSEDPSDLLDAPNQLLSRLAKGAQRFLSELLDRTGGQAEADTAFAEDQNATLLQQVQTLIRNCENVTDERLPHSDFDHSIEIHICHSLQREVEILHDRLLQWFADNPSYQPRSVQIMVAGLDKYTSYIDAIFNSKQRHAAEYIPYAISERSSLNAGPSGSAFLGILRVHACRYSAARVMEILDTEAVYMAFDLSADDVASLKRLIARSAIRWGVDGAWVTDTIKAPVPDHATWRRGLDRMLLGYALGQKEGDISNDGVVNCGALGVLLPQTEIEGDSAKRVACLIDFWERLVEHAEGLQRPCCAQEWVTRLNAVLDTFFHETGDTFAELSELRKIVLRLGYAMSYVGDEPVPLEVIANILETQFAIPAQADALGVNGVLFTPLKNMCATPRPLICIMGISEGMFPRADERSAFDLIAKQSRRGDRSLRLEDRLAFLEAIMCARQNLYISYIGYSVQTNEEIPPSAVVTELRQYIEQTFATLDKAGEPYPLRTVQHYLQPFNAAYFDRKSGMPLSRSKENYLAALQLSELNKDHNHTTAATTPDCEPERVTLKGFEETELSIDRLEKWLTNPAKQFYLTVLKIAALNDSDTVPKDEETFSPDGLQRHQIKDYLLLSAHESSENIKESFLERGLLPFGLTGAATYADMQNEISLFKQKQIRTLGLTVGKMIALRAGIEPQRYAVRIENIVVYGKLTVIKHHSEDMQFFVRPGEAKAKDLLRAWVAHLLLQAAGTRPAITYLIDEKQNKEIIFSPMTASVAVSNLTELLKIQRRANEALLPLALRCSKVFAKAIKNQPEDVSGALNKAYREWEGNNNYSGEKDDPYLVKAWGIDGPIRENAFQELAKKIWCPIFGALDDATVIYEDDMPATGDADE